MAKTPWAGLHSSRIRFRFRVSVFDFFLQWVLGAQTHGLSEVGEVFYAASQVKDGDPKSWAKAWGALAERVERRARASLEGGHVVSARESFLRAYTYHRAPLAFMSPLREAARFKAQYARARACFRHAGALFDPSFEPVEIPFEGKALPGYFLRPTADVAPRKTLIIVGGSDTFVEDLYGYIGPAALKRGYSVLLVDLPMQGMLPFDGLVQRADYETPMAAVMDYLGERPEVDPDRVALFGISGGGYIVPRVAMYEKRIKAIVAFSMLLDVYDVWTKTMGVDKLAKAERRGLLRWAERLPSRRIQTALTLFDVYKWKYGVDSIEGMLQVARGCKADPSAITCPSLILVAQQEYEEFPASRRWQDDALAKIDNANKRLVVMPRDEGADSHAGGTNLSLVSQVVFDWLDELFEEQRVPGRVAVSIDHHGRQRM